MIKNRAIQPIGIDAWRWTGEWRTMPPWLSGISQDRAGSDSLFVQTPDRGTLEASLGMCVVRDAAGEVYVVDPSESEDGL